MNKSLSGLKKLKYDKEHEHELTPKAWRAEKQQLEKEMPELRIERARTCHGVVFAEMISYNKSNLDRAEQNENRQQNRQQTVNKTVGRTKRRAEEI